MTKLKNIAVAIASLVIFANVTHAQTLKASYSISAEEPLKVKYLGEDGNYLLFQVIVQTENPARGLFTIDDKNEGELYASGLATNYEVQTIKIEFRRDQVLNFNLFLGRKMYSKSFSVNINRVETTTVTESDITLL